MTTKHTPEQAATELARIKAYMPFRAWFAVEIAGEWLFLDSLRKVKAAMRKAGLQEANVLTAQ